jgi:site-specific DNA recombinase
MSVRAAVYCRISEDQQDGWGVGDQAEHGRRLAEFMGWDVVGVYVDNDLGATERSRKPRGDYERLKRDIQAGYIDAVCVTEMSRLHRRPLEWHQFRELASPFKLKIKSLTDFIDLSTGEGVFGANLRADIDEEEAEQIRRRVMRRTLSDAKAGKAPQTRFRPFGFRPAGNGALEIVEEEAKLIREATHRLLQGETLGGICTDWQGRGILTTAGGMWRPTPLRTSLMRPALAGYREHPEVGRVRGLWPAVLPEDEWERLQFLFSNPDRRNHGRVNVRSYLLTGFIYCGLCEQPLRGSPRQGGDRTYSCRKDVGFRGCGRIRRRADPVDDEVVERLLYRLDSPALRSGLAAVDDDADLADRDEIAWCKTRLTQLADDYADDTLSKPEYLRQKRRLTERMDAARQRRDSRRASHILASTDGEPVREEWARHDDLDWRRALIAAVIEAVTVHPQRGRKFDPDTIVVLWKDGVRQ